MPVSDMRVSLHRHPEGSRKYTGDVLCPAIPGRHHALGIIAGRLGTNLIHIAAATFDQCGFHMIHIARIQDL